MKGIIGAISGDIIGSVYERNSIKTKDFELFSPYSCFTDDTVMTLGIAKWLCEDRDSMEVLIECVQNIGNQYPNAGYGRNFSQWLNQVDPQPYGSWANGSAMRVSPVAWVGNSLEEVQKLAKMSAIITHDHPEGIKGAQATALAIMMARQGCGKEDIRTEIEKRFEYNLQFTCDEIRPTYTWGGTCQDSVPQAIVAFLDGKDFEDSVRNAISIGGDSDTIGCITGSIAEAYFGVPDELRKQAIKYLPAEFLDIITEFENKYGNK